MIQYYEKKCIVCGTLFTTYKRNRQVHSIECRIAYNKNYMRELMRKKRIKEKQLFERTCVVCKKTFKYTILQKDEVRCVDCKVHNRKVYERDYVALKDLPDTLKPEKPWYENQPDKDIKPEIYYGMSEFVDEPKPVDDTYKAVEEPLPYGISKADSL